MRLGDRTRFWRQDGVQAVLLRRLELASMLDKRLPTRLMHLVDEHLIPGNISARGSAGV